jgi:opine dehydrogenase
VLFTGECIVACFFIIINTERCIKSFPEVLGAQDISQRLSMGEPYQKAGTPKIVNVEHTQGQFMIYRDGATPAVGHVADAVGGERDRVVAALGFEPRPMGPFYEQIQAAEWVHDPCEVGPPTMQHRYLTEDIPYALVPMTYFGDLIQVPTPVSDAVVQISAAANQEDYWTTGLTIEKLGLTGLTTEAILRRVQEGG